MPQRDGKPVAAVDLKILARSLGFTVEGLGFEGFGGLGSLGFRV